MDIISTAISIIVVAVVLTIMQISAGKEASLSVDRTMVLHYPVIIAIVGYASIVLGLLIGIVTLFHLVPMTGEEVVPILVAAFVLMGLPIVIIQRMIRVFADENKIRFRGITGKVHELEWSAIEKVTFNAMTSKLEVQSGKVKIKINTMMKGYNSFNAKLKEKVDSGVFH